MEFLTTPDFKLNSLIKIIGLGGAGGNAVKHMAEIGIKDVDYIVCNTDAQALLNSPIQTKIHMGASLTKGRGAGNKPEIGLNAAIESIEDIKAAIGVDTRMVFITAGLGGGTGTGASPVVAQACREMGLLTVGIVVTPFKLEGPKRINQANEGLEKLAAVVDCLMVISNDSIMTNYGNLGQSKAFALADDVVATAAKSIAEIITISGNTNVDFADVETVLRDSGVAIMGSGVDKGENRAVNAIEKALSSPLLTESNIFGAQNILLNIGSGHQEVTMDEIALIINHLQKAAGGEANLIWGSYIDDKLEDNLHLTVLATGFKKKPDAIKVQSISFEPISNTNILEFEYPDSNPFNPLPDVENLTTKLDHHLDIVVNNGREQTQVLFEKNPEPFKRELVTPSRVNETEITPITKEIFKLESDSVNPPSGEAAENVNKIIQEMKGPEKKSPIQEPAEKDEINTNDELLNSLDTLYDHNIFVVKSSDTNNIHDASSRSSNVRDSMHSSSAALNARVSDNAKSKLTQIKGAGTLPGTKPLGRLNSLKDFNNVDNINEMENTPSYLRKNVALNPVPSSSEAQNSNLSIGVNNKTVIQTNNSYLNKKVD